MAGSFTVLIDDAITRLRDAGVSSPESDVWSLVAGVLGVSRGEAQARALMGADVFDATQADQFESWLQRRQHRQPLWHITGRAPFLELELEVGPGVFTPRPETELLAHQAIADAEAMVPSGDHLEVVDLCAGSGAIGLAIAHRVGHARILAVEVSVDAEQYLRTNVARIAPDSCEVVIGDVAEAHDHRLAGSVDLVVANPPYLIAGVDPVDQETAQGDPEGALFSADGGMEMIRRVIQVARTLLRPGGVVLVEHGTSHGDPIQHALGDAGFGQIDTQEDLLGRPRFTRAVAHRR